MAIIPTLKCTRVMRSIDFYTRILDFDLYGVFPAPADPGYAILTRDGDVLHLSSHAGDGVVGQAVVIDVDEVDALFETFRSRGLDPSGKRGSPVHRGPLDQTWGTREFYVDDPDGNTLRFTRR